MRSHRIVGVSTTEKVLLIVEGVLVAALLFFHFYTDPAGNTLFLAILIWPILILVAVAIACVAIFRTVSARQNVAAPAQAPATQGVPQ